MTTPTPVHISVVLDRSGSMAAIADDIVGGFNTYLDIQKRDKGEARVSLIQFDGNDPFEVLIDGSDIADVTPLTREAYVPRGNTPLFDAVGMMIGRIDNEIAVRASKDLAPEDQIVVIVTDGHENASREHSRVSVYAMIERRREQGWVFVFLGADQDAYAEGTAMGVAGPNAVPWEKSKAGVKAMYHDLAFSTSEHRSKPTAARRRDKDEFYKRTQE